tara:strand:- start:2447 stop:2977 length:531 start_codon:yes stop_codon:yes gene_type:complete
MVLFYLKQMIILFLAYFSSFLYSVTTLTVPTERYKTYQDFQREQHKKQVQVSDRVWKTSSHWKPLVYKYPLIGKFQVVSSTVSLSKFSGNVGDNLSNINRWRRQLGLAPALDTADLKNKTLGEYQAKVIRLHHKSQYLLVYWLTIKSDHYFIKVTDTRFINEVEIEDFIKNESWGS